LISGNKNSVETTCLFSGFHASTSGKLLHAAIHGVSLTFLDVARIGKMWKMKTRTSSKSLFYLLYFILFLYHIFSVT